MSTRVRPSGTPAIRLSVAVNFSKTPGTRLREQGEYSGEEFRDDVLLPKFLEAEAAEVPLIVNLNGVAGFGPSFLEEAFGGLRRVLACPVERIDRTLRLEATEEPYWLPRIEAFIRDAL